MQGGQWVDIINHYAHWSILLNLWSIKMVDISSKSLILVIAIVCLQRLKKYENIYQHRKQKWGPKKCTLEKLTETG